MADLDFADVVMTRLEWERPRTLGAIQEELNVSRRKVEQAVEALRLRGTPICSGSAGVWLTKDPAQMLANVEALRSRAITVMRGARALRQTARRFARYQQLELWGAA